MKKLLLLLLNLSILISVSLFAQEETAPATTPAAAPAEEAPAETVAALETTLAAFYQAQSKGAAVTSQFFESAVTLSGSLDGEFGSYNIVFDMWVDNYLTDGFKSLGVGATQGWQFYLNNAYFDASWLDGMLGFGFGYGNLFSQYGKHYLPMWTGNSAGTFFLPLLPYAGPWLTFTAPTDALGLIITLGADITDIATPGFQMADWYAMASLAIPFAEQVSLDVQLEYWMGGLTPDITGINHMYLIGLKLHLLEMIDVMVMHDINFIKATDKLADNAKLTAGVYGSFDMIPVFKGFSIEFNAPFATTSDASIYADITVGLEPVYLTVGVKQNLVAIGATVPHQTDASIQIGSALSF
jgi:hypothetical protein